MFTSWWVSLVLLVFAASAAAQTCYWPNGDVAEPYQPISSDLPICCFNSDYNHVDLALSNGLCWSNYWGFFYRGACTDPLFNGCPKLCSDCKSRYHKCVDAHELTLSDQHQAMTTECSPTAAKAITTTCSAAGISTKRESAANRGVGFSGTTLLS